MPIPGDALAQVKRALRGLLGRTRRNRGQADDGPTSDVPRKTSIFASRKSTTMSIPQNVTTTGTQATDGFKPQKHTKSRVDDSQPLQPQEGSVAAGTTNSSIGSPPISPTTKTSADPTLHAPTEPESHIHLAEPPQVAEAKAVDLRPTADADKEAVVITPPPALAPDEHGMSATSGPLGDHMAEYEVLGEGEDEEIPEEREVAEVEGSGAPVHEM